MSRPSTREPVTDQQIEDFLDALAEGLTAIDAAARVGRGRRDLYRLRKTREGFLTEWDAAHREGNDHLIGEAQRRAVDGVDEPVFHKGEQVATIKRYSDALLMFLIKQRDTSYRDNVKVEHSSGDNPVKVEVTHSVDDLARVASLLAEAGVVATPGASDAEADEVRPG